MEEKELCECGHHQEIHLRAKYGCWADVGHSEHCPCKGFRPAKETGSPQNMGEYAGTTHAPQHNAEPEKTPSLTTSSPEENQKDPTPTPPSMEWEDEIVKLLDKYRTFGSIEDEDFSPVGYFDDRAAYNDFIKDIKAFIKSLLQEKDAEIEKAEEKEYVRGLSVRNPNIKKLLAEKDAEVARPQERKQSTATEWAMGEALKNKEKEI